MGVAFLYVYVSTNIIINNIIFLFFVHLTLTIAAGVDVYSAGLTIMIALQYRLLQPTH